MHISRASQALVVKNPPANAEDPRNAGLIPGLGRSPGGGHGNPLQYSCLGNPVDRGAWWATVHGVTKSQTWLSEWTELNWNCLKYTHWIMISDSTNMTKITPPPFPWVHDYVARDCISVSFAVRCDQLLPGRFSWSQLVVSCWKLGIIWKYVLSLLIETFW